MATILDGKSMAQAMRAKVKERVARLKTPPGLAVLLVGDNPASVLYVGLKQKACEEAGMRFEKFVYPADVAEQTLLDKVAELNVRPDIDGILVQLPLPSQDADRVVAAIDPKKDVDGFGPASKLAPPVHLGVMKLVDATGHDFRGASAALVCSDLFAAPLVTLMKEHGITATIVSPDASDLASRLAAADIVVTAVGRAGFIRGEMLKPGATVIDVGTSKVNGKIVGDVDRTSVDPVAGFISPVPGGSGPLTVAYLLLNVLKARG